MNSSSANKSPSTRSRPGSKDEQREYFRIRDRAWVDARKIKHAHLSGKAERWFDNSAEIALSAELQSLDHESSTLLHVLAERDTELANYLRLQNRKFELLARSLIQTVQGKDRQAADIQLSASGMQFPFTDTLKPGQWLAVQVMLESEPLLFHCFAEVLDCKPGEAGNYQISAEFAWPNEDARDDLVRHVLRQQARERRGEHRS